MMTLLKKDAVTEALNKAIAQKGEDYIYPYATTQCFYTDPESRGDATVAPSCIVGFVVDAIDHEALERIARHEAAEGESFSVAELGFYAEVQFEENLLAYALQAAQTVQDRGAPWKYAKMAYDLVLSGDESDSESGADVALDEWHRGGAEAQR